MMANDNDKSFSVEQLMRLLARLPDLVEFDWDNNLVRTPYDLSGEERLEAVEYYLRYGLDREYVARLLTEPSPEAVLSLMNCGLPLSLRRDLNHLKVEGAAELLDTLRGLDIPVVLVSNKYQELLELEVRALGWEEKFAAIVGAREGVPSKPAPDLLMLGFYEVFGGESNPGDYTVWYVGDREADMVAANAAGFTGIRYVFQPDPEFRDIYRNLLLLDNSEMLRGDMSSVCEINAMSALTDVILGFDALSESSLDSAGAFCADLK